MGGALDQAGAGVEKLVGLPFQRDAAMGAAVDIEVGNAVPAHGQQLAAVDFKTEAAVWREGCRRGRETSFQSLSALTFKCKQLSNAGFAR